MKTLFTMSIYGSIMVCIVLIMRKLMLYKLPKRLFKFLWILTASRLIIPIWIDAEVKSDSYFYEGMSDISYVSEIPVFPQNPNYTSLEYADVFINLPVAIWIAGCVLVTIFFVCAYFANITQVSFLIATVGSFLWTELVWMTLSLTMLLKIIDFWGPP